MGIVGVEVDQAPEYKVLYELRAYLDYVGFRRIYKYYVGVNNYYVSPFSISGRRDSNRILHPLENSADTGVGPFLRCLMFGQAVEIESMSPRERQLADLLFDIGIVEKNGATIENGGYQLIAVYDFYLFVDIRINLFKSGFHQTYIGIDSYLMLYYLEISSLNRTAPVLDIGTGTGVGALYASQFSDNVVAIDIDSNALKLSEINCHLNAKDGHIDIRRQDMRDANGEVEGYSAVLCNPPFVGYPDDVSAPIFAKGSGHDGLDYVRSLFGAYGTLLEPGGVLCVVADLVGDENGPYFLDELKSYSNEQHLSVDVFIDGRFPADKQAIALTELLVLQGQELERDTVLERVRSYQRNVLRARYYYLTVMRAVSNPLEKGMRIFNRYESAQRAIDYRYWN